MSHEMEYVVTVCMPGTKSKTILVRDGSFVRFAVLDACNALRVPYDKKFGLFRRSNVRQGHYPWIHPNAKFPLINQSDEEALEIQICNNPEFQSNLDVINLMVENLEDPNEADVRVQMCTSSRCYMIPVMYRRLSRQKIEKAHTWNVIITQDELVDNGSRISRYNIKDGDTVRICRE